MAGFGVRKIMAGYRKDVVTSNSFLRRTNK
jgi:hypothetical protein